MKTKSRRAAMSSLVWGIYMMVNGVSLIVFPNIVLPAMGFEPTQEVWIRMVGLLALVLGFYYVQIGRYDIQLFYNWKIVGHTTGILIMITLFLANVVSAAIFGVCVADVIGLAWTALALRFDKHDLSLSLHKEKA